MAVIVMPLPARDFDPTEAAVTWRALSAAGHEVRFATPRGRPARADDIMVSGEGLDPWGFLPWASRVVVIGRLLRADERARSAHHEMVLDNSFLHPLAWSEINVDDFDGVVLPGGHRARGMREYLESDVLQQRVVSFFAADKIIGAICHGVLLVARSVDPATGQSVLFGRRTTALTWSLERKGWHVARVTRFWDRDYYRTYVESPEQSEGFMSVQREVTRALAAETDFVNVLPTDPDAKMKSSGTHRDSPSDDRPALVVVDGNYISARWPGDAHTFAQHLIVALEQVR